MNTLDKRKLNLLVHLAKVDGRFDHSEQELLKTFIREKGLSENLLEAEEQPIHFQEGDPQEHRTELLYWALKLMHADGVVHPREITFCENLADQLRFKKEIVSSFVEGPVPSYNIFEDTAKQFMNPDY